ncbi:MAG TPA: tetratricopeptide repeat protein [Devosiaceae bacterium]|nr:tetratricopeptide repeat protein [Devosiaceae bacterium]
MSSTAPNITGDVPRLTAEPVLSGEGEYCGSASGGQDQQAKTPLESAPSSGVTQSASNSQLASLYCAEGNAAMIQGDLDKAAENYKTALRLDSQLTAAWCNLGNVCARWGRSQDAIALYLQALAVDRLHVPSRTNLVQTLISSRQYPPAKAFLLELVAERPGDVAIRKELGKLHQELGELDLALACFEEILAADPQDAESLYWIGGVKQKAGDLAGANAAYLVAATLQPMIRRPAATLPEFRVLALFAPLVGNTPSEYLLGGLSFETNTAAVLDGARYDLQRLRQGGQIVVSLISDADQAGALLEQAAELVDGLGLPVINHPSKIAGTTREAMASRLQGIPHCRIPRIARHRAETGPAAARDLAAGFAFPLLVRPAGTHAGTEFELLDSLDAVETFALQHPGVDLYLIEYADFRSADGFFRKYRFIFVGGEILPYHLAVGEDWKLHHDNTRMAEFPWMQQEEARFLADPGTAFGPAQQEALRSIGARVDLEYFGIDCGIDRAGNLVIFEANASMLVHRDNQKFAYKGPFVEKIRTAYEAMLRKMVNRGADNAEI